MGLGEVKPKRTCRICGKKYRRHYIGEMCGPGCVKAWAMSDDDSGLCDKAADIAKAKNKQMRFWS